MRPQACAILLVLIVLLSAPFLHLTYALSSTGKQAPTSAWQHCLIQYAHDIDIHPALLRAIVQAESAGHPWAFGWNVPLNPFSRSLLGHCVRKESFEVRMNRVCEAFGFHCARSV